MSIDIPLEKKDERQNPSRLREFEQTHKKDLEAIVKALASMTNRTPEEVQLHFDTMLEHLMQSEKQERPFFETATPQEWVQAFHEWVESHRGMNLPTLSDEAISRESIYGERG
jgi:hypothetical protein